MTAPGQKNILEKLQSEILSLQGFRLPTSRQRIDFGLGPIEAAFPGRSFPTGLHEFISASRQDAAATAGFMACLLSSLMQSGTGICLWISTKRTIFPPALAIFDISPDRIIFIDLTRQKDALWAMEEALKCEALACVVAEINEISFTASRRLQLVVEKSRVPGFVHRHNLRSVNTLACVCRWKITPVSSELEQGMPGVGHARWQVALQKVRNGEPGSWQVGWAAGRFEHAADPARQARFGTDHINTGTYG